MQNKSEANEQQYQKAVVALEKLISKVKPSTSSSMKSCIVGLYTADDDNPLRFSGQIGMLQLDIDRALKVHFIRFYNIDTLQLLFEVEMFYGFEGNFRSVDGWPSLFVFDFFADGIVGFFFKNQLEAALMVSKIKSTAPKLEDFREIQKEKIRHQIEEKKSHTFFGKLKKKFMGSGEDHHPQHQESVVLKVEKQKSIAINMSTGEFDMENIPPQWEEMFQNMGLAKEDMKSKEIMQFVFEETLMHQFKKAAQENPEGLKQEHLNIIREYDREGEEMPIQNESSPPPAFEAIEKEDESSKSSSLPPPPPPPLENGNPDVSQQFLPPPPPPPPLPTLQPASNTQPSKPDRSNLMAEIRNNQLKLKPVKTNEKGELELDASAMNKQQRRDLAEHIRLKLQRRKLALKRRNSSDSENSDSE